MPSQCAESIMTVFDLLMALCMGTEDNGEYVQNVIYSGRVLIVQKNTFLGADGEVNTVNQQILAAIKFGVSQNKVIWRLPVYAVYDHVFWRDKC